MRCVLNFRNIILTVRFISAGVICGALFASAPVSGQELNPVRSATVSVASSHEVVLVPEKIRLQMLVRAESREAENAIQLLKKQQERVTKELTTLGAVSSSIEFTTVTISVGTPGLDDPDVARRMARQQAAQMAQMRNNIPLQLRGQMPTPAAEDQNTELPQIFTATTALSAEWQLNSGLDEATILFPSKLKTAIDEKDFRGKKLKETLDPEEQTLIQSLLGVPVYSSTTRQPELLLVYAAKLSDAQEEEALSVAFKKAQSHAAVLAKASGRKLGALLSISANWVDLSRNYPPAYGQNMSSPMTGLVKRNVREVVSEDPSSLRQTVSVNVNFHLE